MRIVQKRYFTDSK